MSIEAMKQALEALHFARLSIDEWSGYASDYFQNKYDLKGDIAEVEQAITALRTAIEQAEKQEPVANASAWFALVMNAAAELEDASHCLRDEDAKRVAISGSKHYRDAAKALYTTPPAGEKK